MASTFDSWDDVAAFACALPDVEMLSFYRAPYPMLNGNDTLLATLSLKSALEKAGMPLDPAAFFDRLGMTRTFAEHDKDGDYILSSQVWTSARDRARLGLLYQNDGMWRGERLLPAGGRRFVATPSGP